MRRHNDGGAVVEWFVPSHDDIRRENVREWLLWALFSSTLEHASPEWDGEIEEYLDLIEQVLGRKLAEGRGPVKSIRLSFDEVEFAYRPLVWYMANRGARGYQYITHPSQSGIQALCPFSPQHFVFPPRILLWMFSRPGVTPHYSYWFRPGRLSHKRESFVFLHGIGIGLHPYLPMLREIVKADPSRDILLVEFLPVSMRITGPMASRQCTVEAMNDILDSLELRQVVLAAHSYGTFLAAYIVAEPAEDGPVDDPCKDLNDKVVSLVLIDPIPILLHLPTVTYNFLYRSPRRANEWQLWYFASSDADVTRMLRRGFFWEEGCLWREDLERFIGEGSSRRQVSVVIGGADQIIPSAAIREYLSDGSDDWVSNAGPSERWANSDETLQVIWFPNLDHATVFETKERRKVLMRVLDPKPRFTVLSLARYTR
ncbi:unnamed protein product [Mycena citricolor]|uniref:AB hydrolase-1 domain-containing protein n=1 Tax=Mycena citricolor TaxID=2018698 RepID=A0AAD2Q0Z0_9AGAR|nr:unnamed protein product [Mycena citricolor]